MADTKNARTTAPTAPPRNMTGIIIALAGGLVVVLLIAAVLFGNTEVGAEYGDPTVEGQGLPIMPPNQTIDATAAGLEYPSVTGQDFDGSTVTIANDDGRAKAIAFLAHWCPFCQQEVPLVQDWIDTTGGDPDVDIYTVSTSMNSGRDNFPPSAWLEREGWTSPVIRDDNENSVLLNFGAGGFPFWVFVNSDGTVAVRTAGLLETAQFIQILDTLE
ncbi:MAG: TlpA disulfide reductase family protein [Acidimicrobiia bacterium]